MLCKQGVTGSIPVTSTNFFSDRKALSRFISRSIPAFWPRLCTNGVIAPPLCTMEARTNPSIPPVSHLIRLAVQLGQSFAFHLRRLLEDSRVALTRHLGHLFVRCAISTGVSESSLQTNAFCRSTRLFLIETSFQWFCRVRTDVLRVVKTCYRFRDSSNLALRAHGSLETCRSGDVEVRYVVRLFLSRRISSMSRPRTLARTSSVCSPSRGGGKL